MDTKVIDTKGIMLKNGLYLGLASIALSVIPYVLGITFKVSTWIGLLGFLVMILFIVLGIKQFKVQRSGFLKIGEALKVGVGIALIGGIIGVIYTLVFNNVIDPNFIEEALEFQRTEMIKVNPNITEDQLEMALEMARKMSSPIFSIPLSIGMSLFLGFIISLIAGAVMQKKENNF